MPFRRLFSFVAAVLFVSIALPAYAHDLPIGGSWWAFGNNAVVGRIDLKSALVAEIEPVKEAHLNLDAFSDAQLQRAATDIIQPYINKRLTVTVDDKTYPVRVNKFTRNENNLYTIWLSADGVAFNKAENPVKIVYSLLFEETSSEHMNLASGYVSDAKGDELQKLFDFHQPQFRTTFDAKNQVWEVSVKGVTNVAAKEPKAESPAVSTGLEGEKNRAAQKSHATGQRASVPVPKGPPKKQSSEDKPVVPPTPPLRVPPPGQAMPSIAQDTVKGDAWTTIRQFVPLGIEHILTGYDHIAFLLAIIVIGLSIKEVLKVITAFTIAHSVTLLLAAMDIIRLNSRFVESVIAFSICYVAVENIFKRKVHYRWVITFGFGLIHGFGFASALGELILRKASLLLSVVSFNVGVEIGQLMVFFIMLPVLYLLNKLIAFRVVTVCTSVGIFALAFTWLVERVFSLRLLWF